MKKSCVTCLFSEDYSKITDEAFCFNEAFLERLPLNLKQRGAVERGGASDIESYTPIARPLSFSCGFWMQKTPLCIQERKVVSITKLGKFGGFYVQCGAHYYKLQSDRPYDFIPVFSDVVIEESKEPMGKFKNINPKGALDDETL